jgi:hypothetical protein
MITMPVSREILTSCFDDFTIVARFLDIMFLSFFLISFYFSSTDTILSAANFTTVHTIYVPKKTRGEPSIKGEIGSTTGVSWIKVR